MLNKQKKWLVFLLLMLWLFFSMFPVYWVLTSSVKNSLAFKLGPKYIPFLDFHPTFDIYKQTFSGIRGGFLNNFINSVIVSFSATAVSVILGSMVAYALVRYVFKVKLLAGLFFFIAGIGSYVLLVSFTLISEVFCLGIAFLTALVVGVGTNSMHLGGPVLGNKDIAFWFIAQRMMPPIVSAFALYLLFSKIGKAGFVMLDTYFGITLCYIAFSLPLVVWLMRDFFLSLPVEMEEAALIDNVPRLRIFFEIVLPNSLQGFFAVSLITFSFIWNEFLFGFLLTTGNWQTLPVLLAAQYDWRSICVATIITIAPMIILTFFLSRMMKSGFLSNSIK